MNSLQLLLKRTLLLLLLMVLGVHTSYAQRISVSGKQFVVNGNRIWLNGANTPWDNWNDFGGSFDYSWWDNHFQTLKDKKVNCTRVWITCNGEVGININSNGYISGATATFYDHVDQLMQIAQSKGIYLMIALVSFDHVKDNHNNYQRWRNMLGSAANRQSFVDNFVAPFVDRYKDNPYFFAVDVSNEIEWMFENYGVSASNTQDLVARTANKVHSRSKVLVCQGLGLGPKYASPLYEGNYYSDANLSAKQSGAYLDFYKVHYYNWQNPYFSNPFDKSPSDWQINDKPCVIGESAAKGSAGYTSLQCTQRAFARGWQGYMPWTSNGVDGNGDINDMDDGSVWFHNNYPNLVYPATNTPPPTASQTPYSGSPVTLPGTVEAENYDKGGSGVAYLDSDPANNGGSYRNDGVDVQVCSEGGYNVGWINSGEWLEYTVDVSKAGTYDVALRVASPNTTGQLRIAFEGSDKTGTIGVPNTGGWQSWQTVSLPSISLSSGQQVMRIAIEGGSFNFNKLSFNATIPDTGNPPNPAISLNAWDASTLSAGITDNDGWGLGDVEAGEWFMFSNVNLSDGYDKIEAEFASTESGTLAVRLGSSTGTKIGEINWSSSGGWGTFAWRSGNLTGGSGVQDLYLVMESGTANIARLRLNDTNAAARIVSAPTRKLPLSKPLNFGSAVQVYPNPAVHTVSIVSPTDEHYRVAILNANGKLVKEARDLRGKLSVEVEDLKAGLYFVQIIGPTGQQLVKMLKE